MTAGILVWAYTLLLPTFADIGVVGQRILDRRPVGLGLLRPQHLFGLDLPPLVHGVLWSLGAQYRRLYRLLAPARSRSPIERLQANMFVPSRSDADRAELPALALLGDGRGTDRDGRALSRRGAHAHGLRELCRRAPHQPRAEGRGRFPAGAPRRAHSRLRDRRARRRGWCCRCCCASARSRPRRR